MQFVDEIRINVKGGKGGNGVIRFNPEYGPSGGTGGDGGNVIFHATHNCNTLSHLSQYAILKAKDGSIGTGADASQGKKGTDLIVDVPIGTIVKNNKTNEVLFDLKKEGKYIVTKGGRGGRGNSSFVTNLNKAPRIYEYGMPGEEYELKLEVRILADCGIIGYPSTGKSTFISIVSNAKPQIAPYHFTTLSPVVGVVTHKKQRIIIADLPGLIEGASKGKGLGIKFLKHASRCKILAHFISADSLNYIEDYKKIRIELKKFSIKLYNKPEVICITKADLGIDELQLKEIKRISNDVFVISSHINQNITKLLDFLINQLSQMKNPEIELKNTNQEDEVEVIELIDTNKKMQIYVEFSDNKFKVLGEGAKTLVLRCPLDTEDNITRFSYILNTKKIFHKLKKIGWTMNDDIYFPFNKVLCYVDGLLQQKPL